MDLRLAVVTLISVYLRAIAGTAGQGVNLPVDGRPSNVSDVPYVPVQKTPAIPDPATGATHGQTGVTTAQTTSSSSPSSSSTEVRNVTICRPGFGYPEYCPREEDGRNLTKCCRYYHEPRCCEERARKVCASRNKGSDFVSGIDIDPDPSMVAIFCPMVGQPETYTSCANTRDDIGCYNRETATIIVWVTAAIIFFLSPLAFGLYVWKSIRKERKREKELTGENTCLKSEQFVVAVEETDSSGKQLPLKRSRSKSGKSETKSSDEQDATEI